MNTTQNLTKLHLPGLLVLDELADGTVIVNTVKEGGWDADKTGLGFLRDLFAIFVLGTIWWHLCCRREAKQMFQVR